jgi:hypothetical protein
MKNKISIGHLFRQESEVGRIALAISLVKL